MKKKTLFILGGSLLVVVIAIVIFLIFFKNNQDKNKDIKEECLPLAGGSFTLKINKNNNEAAEEISVCIACSPDSYEKIEDPVYDGYKFIGWYFDSEFKEKAEFDTTLDIQPIQETDAQGCVVGYQTIEIFAKWENVEAETTTKTKTAKCPSGYTLSNNVCTMTTTIDATPVYVCNEGTLNGTKCILTENTIYNCVKNGFISGVYDINKGFAFGTIVNGQCQVTYKKADISDDFIGIGDVFDFENLVCNGIAQGTCTISVTSVEQYNMCNDGYTYSNGTCIKETNASVAKYTCSEGTLSGTKCTIVKMANPTYE